jgi:molybdenum cofactor biosynthesis enzyme MoaA
VGRNAGVVYLQLTGGEPTIDRLFCQTYELAWTMGMMLHISTNASRLHDPASWACSSAARRTR